MRSQARFLRKGAWLLVRGTLALGMLTFSLSGCQSVVSGERAFAAKTEESDPAGTSAVRAADTRLGLSLPRPVLPESVSLSLPGQLPEPRIIVAPVASLDMEAREAREASSDSISTSERAAPFLLPEPEVAKPPGAEHPHLEAVFSRMIERAVLSPKTDESIALTTEGDRSRERPAPAKDTESSRVLKTPVQEEALSVRAERGTPALAVEEHHRRLIARRGDTIGIDLEGGQWIYIGVRRRGSDAAGASAEEGISFVSNQHTAQKSSFRFTAENYGEYEISFQSQDNVRAVLHNEIVQVQVLPEEQFSAALGLQTGTAEPISGKQLEQAEMLFESGEYELACIEYLKNYRDGDAHLNDRLAACYSALGEPQAAVKYYTKNVGLSGEYGDRAVTGIIHSAVELRDSRLVIDALPSLVALETVPIENELLEIGRFQAERQGYSTAITVLQEYLDRYPAGSDVDEVYYRLAEIYEQDSPHRDLRKARDYYLLLYERFPESRFADSAGKRIHYLNRHFFLVQ